MTRPPWPAADWEPIRPFPFAAARDAFSGLTSDPERVLMRYFRRPDGRLVATAHFGRRTEGAPSHVHGGSILTVLDEALGAAAWVAGHPVLTVRLTTDFRKGVPLGADLLVETRLTAERGRLVLAEGSLLGPDGVVYAEARGRFMRLSEAAHRRVFGRAA